MSDTKFRAKDLVEILGIPKVTVQRRIDSGKIPTNGLKRRRYCTEAQLRAYIEGEAQAARELADQRLGRMATWSTTKRDAFKNKLTFAKLAKAVGVDRFRLKDLMVKGLVPKPDQVSESGLSVEYSPELFQQIVDLFHRFRQEMESEMAETEQI